jgi:hypothetical protein
MTISNHKEDSMSKKLEDRSTFVAAILFFALLWALTSADCATGGSCNFANGDLANWIFPKVKAMEEFFSRHLAGRFPFVG